MAPLVINSVREALALPSDLARVARAPGREAGVSFYAAWGLLGRTELEGSPRRVYEHESRRWVLKSGDPLSWAFDHAGNVAMALRLIGGARQPRSMVKDLEWVADRQAAGRFSVPTTAKPWATQVQLDVGKSLRKVGPAETGRALLAELLNPNLGTIRRVIDPSAGRSRVDFVALVQVAYWVLAEAADGHNVRPCAACPVLFVAHDERQTYCPPPPGVRESRCGRVYRERERRKAESRRAFEHVLP